jgi:hypothetical protein
MSLAGAARLLRVSTSAISRVLHRIAQERSESFNSTNKVPPSLFVLPPISAIGIVVRVVIWIWIIVWIVRVCVIIWFRTGLPTAFRTDYSILRESDQANRIGV